MSARIDPAVLLSRDPTFVVDAKGRALVCRLYRADCGDEREVGVEARPARIEESGEAAPTGEPTLDLRVGVDCGYMYFAEGGIADPAEAPVLECLDAAIDGRFLDALAQRWLSERRQERRVGHRRSEEPYWAPGQPLAWEEAFEVLREDNLHGPRGCYGVFDLYFIEPEDDRREVIIHFGEGPHGPTREVGGVRVGLASGDLEMMPQRGRSKLLRYLWARYQQRYPDFSHVEARWPRMREVGIELKKKWLARGTQAP